MYIFFIFGSQVIAHDVKPRFLIFVVHADFRKVNVDTLCLCPVFYLCRWMSYSYYKHVVKIKMIYIYIYIYRERERERERESCVWKQKKFCCLLKFHIIMWLMRRTLNVHSAVILRSLQVRFVKINGRNEYRRLVFTHTSSAVQPERKMYDVNRHILPIYCGEIHKKWPVYAK